MLYECAAHGTRVCGDEVLYIGWKSYGITVQEVPVGANLICPKLFAALATMKPLWPVVRSLMSVRSPCAVSDMVTWIRSPDPMKRSRAGSGAPDVSGLKSSGFGGPVGTPFLVRNAKFTYSIPPRTWPRQVPFRSCPLTGSRDRLSMVSAAHHWVTSQLWLSNCFTQPGG